MAFDMNKELDSLYTEAPEQPALESEAPSNAEEEKPEVPTEESHPSEVDEKKDGTKNDDQESQRETELPKSIKKGGDKVQHAFIKQKNKFESRIKSMQEQIESLQEQLKGKSFADSIDDRMKLVNLQGRKEEVESQFAEANEEWENELALETAENIIQDEQLLGIYKNNIAPHRNEIYQEANSINPVLARFIKSSRMAPAWEIIMANPATKNRLASELPQDSMRAWHYLQAKENEFSFTPASKPVTQKPKVSTPSAVSTVTKTNNDLSLEKYLKTGRL